MQIFHQFSLHHHHYSQSEVWNGQVQPLQSAESQVQILLCKKKDRERDMANVKEMKNIFKFSIQIERYNCALKCTSSLDIQQIFDGMQNFCVFFFHSRIYFCELEAIDRERGEEAKRKT